MARYDPAGAVPAQCRRGAVCAQAYLDCCDFEELHMDHTLKWVLAGAMAAAIVAGLIVTIYRRKRAVPGIVKHPERLDEMLDSTDDA
jgi:hypothetical protein